MSIDRNHPDIAGALFYPKASSLGSNRDYLEISGWCTRSLVGEAFSLSIQIGKRQIVFPLSDIPAVETCLRGVCSPDQTRDGQGAFYFFRTEIKIGKGLKRMTFALEHEDGRKFSLGTRTVFQKNRMESSPQNLSSEDAKTSKSRSEYENWLNLEEPKLRSANDFPLDEMVFPQSLIWIIELHRGDLWDLLRTLQSTDVGGVGSTDYILLDRAGFFEGKQGQYLCEVFSSMGNVSICDAASLNRMLGEMGTEGWAGFLREGDEVESHFQDDFFRFLANHPETELFYTDFDHLFQDGSVGECRILPAWNRDLLHSYPYIGETFLLKLESLLRIGGIGAEAYHQKWALQLKFSQSCRREQVGRLCGVYFHLKERYEPHGTVGSTEEGTRLLQSHLAAMGNQCEVTVAPGTGGWRTRYPIPSPAPRVSLMIPTRDGLSVLKTTIDSILEKTLYPNFEILVLDNDSEEQETLEYFETLKKKGCRIIPCPGKFNYSQINNRGSMEATGEILGFLNNDLEVIDGEWLTEMVGHACRQDVGAVGAKLLYPDKRLQHAGVLIGVGHVAAHAFRLFENDPEKGPLRAHLIQNYSAVTAACLIVRAEIFKTVGGFDDVNLAITNNDVDLCIKIREAGYRNVYTPYAVLFHHESATRGPEDTPEKFERYQKEVNYMWKQWSDILMNDPAYNRLLTRFQENFSLASSEQIAQYIPGKIF